MFVSLVGIVVALFGQAVGQVEDAVACGECCLQLNEGFDQGAGAGENVFNFFTCQTIGCVADGTDCNDIEDEFDKRGCEVGEAFRESGIVTLPDGDAEDPNRRFFCSVGGELSVVEFEDSDLEALLNDNNQCFDCCNQLNQQFDELTNDEYSVQACRERCSGEVNIPTNVAEIDVFDEDLNECVQDEDDNLNDKPNFFFNGCVQAQQFLLEGFVDFKGIRHFCQNLGVGGGELESVGAVRAQTTNDNQVNDDPDNDCAKCCDALDSELDAGDAANYDVNNCKEEGCHANLNCDDLVVASEINGCELGEAFLAEGKVEFSGNDVLCQRGGLVKGAVVDVNEVLVVVNNDETGIIVGAVGGSLGAIALLAALVLVFRRRPSTERNVMESPRIVDYPPVGSGYQGGGYQNSPNVYQGNGQYSRNY